VLLGDLDLLRLGQRRGSATDSSAELLEAEDPPVEQNDLLAALGLEALLRKGILQHGEPSRPELLRTSALERGGIARHDEADHQRTSRVRQRVTKGAGSRGAGLAMVHRLLLLAERTWRRLDGHELLPLVRAAVKFKDGAQVERNDGAANMGKCGKIAA
jgi:hypothetical protein